MKIHRLIPPLLTATLLCACAVDNDPSIHYSRSVSVGQELIELHKAREIGAITDGEYRHIKRKLLQQLAMIPHKK